MPNKVMYGVVLPNSSSTHLPTYTKINIVTPICTANEEYLSHEFGWWLSGLLGNGCCSFFAKCYFFRYYAHLAVAVEFSTRFNDEFTGVDVPMYNSCGF